METVPTTFFSLLIKMKNLQKMQNYVGTVMKKLEKHNRRTEPKSGKTNNPCLDFLVRFCYIQKF